MSATQSVACGPFDVLHPIGEGGMARVWKGRHRREGVSVALKFIKHLADADDSQIRQFRREARAHAGLEHPHIVRLLDYGELEEPLELDESVPAGTPYLAVEFAAGGTLWTSMPIVHWGGIREILLQMLDALAFAHARQVVHRDLKPENVLAFARRGSGTRWKLSDFGVAHSASADILRYSAESHPRAGTPYYMSPEQIEGEWRAFGPWTDLYQLGVMGWELVTGEPPFPGNDAPPIEVARQHMDGSLPAFEPRYPVPDGLEAWLRRLLAPDQGLRFRRADAAARALKELDEPAPADRRPGGARGNVRETLPSEQLPSECVSPTARGESTDPMWGGAMQDEATDTAETEASDLGRVEGAVELPEPRVPDTWPRESRDSPPLPLVGAGLELFQLRDIPMVDRAGERNTLWRALQHVARESRPGVVTIQGPSGVGKSRLVRWLARRGHEVGACTVLKASHGPANERTSGLVGMLEDFVKSWDLSRDETARRIRQTISNHLAGVEDHAVDSSDIRGDVETLATYLRPHDMRSSASSGGHRTSSLRFNTQQQSLPLLNRFIRYLAMRRPVLVWIDDAHWAEESLDWVQFAFDGPPVLADSPVLFALTLRDDLAGERHNATTEECRRLVERQEGWRIHLEHLAREDHESLVRRLLALEPSLTRDVCRRTEGNPLFADELVGDWVERDLLRVGEEGFELIDDASPQIPDAVHDLWVRRLERLVDDLADDAAAARDLRRSLELAAILGRRLVLDEWRRACQLADIDPPEGLVETLVDRGLAEATTEGPVEALEWTHRLLVESLERMAREHERWRDHHRTCAQLMGVGRPGREAEDALRRSEHLAAAGELDASLEALDRAFPHIRGRVAFERQREVLEQRRQLMEWMSLADDDPRRLKNAVECASLHLNRDIGAAGRLVRDLEPRLRRLEYPEMLIRVLLVKAGVFYHRGHVDRAPEVWEEIEQWLPSAGEASDHLRGRLCYQRGHAACILTGPGAAVQWFERAGDVFRDLGETVWAFRADVKMPRVYLFGGRLEAARRLATRLLGTAREEEYDFLEAGALRHLALAALFEGKWEEASKHLEHSVEITRSIGSKQDEVHGRLCQAHVALERERWNEAGEHLADVQTAIRDRGLKRHVLATRLGRAWRSAGLGDADGWKRWLRRARAAADERRHRSRQQVYLAEGAAARVTARELEATEAARRLEERLRRDLDAPEDPEHTGAA